MVNNIIQLFTLIFALILIVLVVILKKKILKELVIAILFSMLWTSLYFYDYGASQWFIFKEINMYALFGWILGFVVIAQIYEFFKNKYGIGLSILFTWLIYLPILFLLEYVFYNILNVSLNSNFDGLFGFDIIHGTILLKLFYIFSPIIYLGIIELVTLGVESEN